MSIPRAPLHEKFKHYAHKLWLSVLPRQWLLHFHHTVYYNLRNDQSKVLTSTLIQMHACVCECVYNTGFIEISPYICLGWRTAQWLDVGVMEREGVSVGSQAVLAFAPVCLHLRILSRSSWIFLRVIFCVWDLMTLTCASTFVEFLFCSMFNSGVLGFSWHFRIARSDCLISLPCILLVCPFLCI